MEEYKRKILLKRTGASEFQIGDADEYHSRPHMCETCGKRFTLLENLTRHQMIHTDERPFICSYCKKRFRLAQHLKEHVRIHTGEKPYKCTTCGRAFCQISNLKSHQKTHTKIKAYRCDICEKSFRRSFTLKQHKLTHTRRSHSGVTGDHVPEEMRHQDHKSLSRKGSAPNPPTSDQKNRGNWKDLPQSLPRVSPNFSAHISEAAATQILPYNFNNVAQAAACPSLQPPSEDQAILRTTVTTLQKAEQHMTQCLPVKKEPGLLPFVPTQASFPHFPSLSALLSQKDAVRREVNSFPTRGAIGGRDRVPFASEAKQFKHPSPTRPKSGGECSVQGPAIFTSPIRPPPALIDCKERYTSDESSDTQNGDSTMLHSCSCFLCDRTFQTGAELRDHVISCHSRKDHRRDSAYSSHSDKSLPSSPNGKALTPLTQPTNQRFSPNCDVMTAVKHKIAETTFMQRVKELALQALAKTNPNARRGSHSSAKRARYEAGKPVLSSGEEYDEKTCEETSIPQPDVGHSPTEVSSREVASETPQLPDQQTSETERKFVTRASGGPQKWKRQLCNEWYEHPAESCSDHPEEAHDVVSECRDQTGNCDDDCATREDATPSSKHDATYSPFVLPPRSDECPTAPSTDRLTSNVRIDSDQAHGSIKSTSALVEADKHPLGVQGIDFQRFAPVVEWKPVVTGWRDVVYGTMYAVPSQLQQNYPNFAPLAGSPELIYPQPSLPTSKSPEQPYSAAPITSAYGSAGHFFRFSPVSVEKFMQGFETPITQDGSGSTTSTSVYSHMYPQEPLPIPGYSRLQHGLLYNWDPNRVRLGGTSSIPQSANLVEAS